MNILVGFLIVAAVFVVASLIAAPLIEADVKTWPQMHFYSAEAYANCGAMRDAAAAQGFKRWACHKPKEYQE